MKKIKELFAMADKKEGKIYLSNENSLTYLHELAHLEYSNNPINKRLELAESNYQFIALLFIIIGVAFSLKPFIYISVISIVISMLIGIREEIVCWIVALKKREAMRKS